MRFCRLFLIVMLCFVVCIGLLSVSGFAAEYVFSPLPETDYSYWFIWQESSSGRIFAVNQSVDITKDSDYYRTVSGANRYEFVDGDWVFVETMSYENGYKVSLLYHSSGVYCSNDSVEFLVPPSPPPTIDDILGDIVDIFNSCISWVGSVGSTIMEKPILLFYAALPLCGIGVGFFKRLKS